MDRFESELVSIMQAGRELGFGGRERLRALLLDVFDIPYMARVLLGNYGRDMPADKRVALEDVILFAVSALAVRLMTMVDRSSDLTCQSTEKWQGAYAQRIRRTRR